MYSTRVSDNYKYICPQQGSSKIHKPTLNQIKRHIDKNTEIVGDLNIPLSEIEHPGKN